MDLLIKIENQRIRIPTNLNYAVEGSQKFVRFHFKFTDNWNGLTIFAQFGQNGKAYNIYLDSKNCVYLPSEIVEGECTLVLYGVLNDVIATTNFLRLRIDKNILVENADSTAISTPIYNQLINQIKALNNRIDNVADDPLFLSKIEDVTNNKIQELANSGELTDIVVKDNSISEIKLDNNLKNKINDKVNNIDFNNALREFKPIAKTASFTDLINVPDIVVGDKKYTIKVSNSIPTVDDKSVITIVI